tara:strand:- start:43 stop:180 length:138 start_codon:yes stop_codon:yes gene_type:complete
MIATIVIKQLRQIARMVNAVLAVQVARDMEAIGSPIAIHVGTTMT